jgi:hypothetical protein
MALLTTMTFPAPGDEEVRTSADTRHSVSSIAHWAPGKGGHQGDRLVRSFCLTAGMAVRLNDSFACRRAVNERRQ